MILRLGVVRLAGLAVPLALLAACQNPPPIRSAAPPSAGQGGADAATIAHCRQRAEEIYMTQNRSELYRTDSRDSPFSGSHGAMGATRGLSDRFSQDRMIADCIRNTGERTDPTHTQPANPPAPPSGSVGPGFTTPKAPPPPRR